MTLAPHPFDVEVGDGHGYMLDRTRQGDWRHETIPLLRPVFITSDTLGEKNLNPESLWRFSDRDWSHGAGQRRADMPDSDTARFWKSQGVNPWTKWQLSLLSDVESVPGSPGAFKLFAVQNYLYALGPSGLSFTSDLVTWQTVGSAFPNTVATDGATIYYTDSATLHLFSAPVGSTVGTSYNPAVIPENLEFVKGRLLNITLDGQVSQIYNIIGPAGTDVILVGTTMGGSVPPEQNAQVAAEGPDFIYLLVNSPDNAHSKVVKIGIAGDGTALTPPVGATPVIPGSALVLAGWIGLVFIGFDDGFRMCIPQSDGSLSVGALVKTGSPCGTFTDREDFLYFGWGGFADAGAGNTYTGLGRIDPTTILDSGAPAYASDLMMAVPTADATTGAAANFNGRLVFVDGSRALYVESLTDLVPSGYLDSGLISYDLPDDKAARYLTIRTGADSDGDITPSIAVDESSTFTALAVVPAGTLTQRDPISGQTGGNFEVRITLARDGSDHTKGAVLTRDMLESEPIIASGSYLYVPVLLTDPVDDANDQPQRVDVNAELTYLEGLRDSGALVTYREFGNSYQVTVQEIQWLPTHPTADRSGANATCLLKLKTI